LTRAITIRRAFLPFRQCRDAAQHRVARFDADETAHSLHAPVRPWVRHTQTWRAAPGRTPVAAVTSELALGARMRGSARTPRQGLRAAARHPPEQHQVLVEIVDGPKPARHTAQSCWRGGGERITGGATLADYTHRDHSATHSGQQYHGLLAQSPRPSTDVFVLTGASASLGAGMDAKPVLPRRRPRPA
jgi:hypothetical protein